ncbi:Regulatory protein RecX [Azospirillaceae bacterium]
MAADEASFGSRSREPRLPKPVTEQSLEDAAVAYLERYAASETGVRRVLMARVDRSFRLHGTNRDQGRLWVEALIERFRRLGFLNDAAYARTKALSLRRRGASTRAIRDRLAAQGIAPDLTQAALIEAAQEILDVSENEERLPDEADEAAAKAFARRRRLGPFRAPQERAERRMKDIAALGRAGFSYETARRVIDANLEE